MTEVITAREGDRQLIEFDVWNRFVMVGEIVKDEETPKDHVAVIVYVPFEDILDGTV